MTQEQWKLAWALICDLEDLPAAEQEAILRSSNAPPDVLDHVRSVIVSQREPEQLDNAALAEELMSFGPYRLLETLGEGSMGSVYLAQQQKPLQRLVALKVIRPGLRSHEVLQRFEIERRALALMDHPHIARVFEAGQSSLGLPYFAMEYVPGVDITTYCQRHGLSLRQKLELLITACEAIQHAHQKGIIHRDIKPSNVLVADADGRPMLKIIDFGIARATQEAGLDTLGTSFGSLVGTAAYMSPEQASLDSSAVDTRSDVYSLGVLAYRLLAGSTPVPERASPSNLPTILDRVRREDPELPSRRAPALASQLAGELDWIIMKALERDPARRYQTANALAQDIQRYLQGEAVEAGAPSAAYRLKKLARRHRRLLATAAAFALVLTLATFVSIRQALRATAAEQQAVRSRDRAVQAEAAAVASRDEARQAEQAAKAERDRALAERRRADVQAATTRAVSDFLQNDLLKLANTVDQANRGFAAPTRDLKVRELLDRAAASIGGRFAQQPEVEAEIRHTIGTSYFNLGLLAESQTHFERAHQLRQTALGPLHPATLDSLHGIGQALRAKGSFPQAHRIFSEAAEGRRRTLGPENRDTLQAMHSIALALRSQGKNQEAIAQHRQVLDTRRRVLGAEDPDTLRSLNDLAVANIYAGNSAAGLELAEQAYRLRARVLGPEHPDTVVSLQAYGMGLFETNQGEQALEVLQRVHALSERLRGPDHINTLNAIGSIGNAYVTLRRFDDAARQFTQAADAFARLYGEKNPSALSWRANATNMLVEAGRFDEALPQLRALLPLLVEVQGKRAGDVQRAIFSIGRCLIGTVQWSQAIEFTSRQPFSSRNGAVLARAYAGLGNWAEAEALYRRSLATRSGSPAIMTELETGLAAAVLEQGRYQEAETLARGAKPPGGPDAAWHTSYLQAIIAAAQAGQGRARESEPALLAAHRAMTSQRPRLGAPEHYKLEWVSGWIARLHSAQPGGNDR